MTDFVQKALQELRPETPNWYGWAKIDNNGNKIPNELRMCWEHAIVIEDGVTKPTKAEFDAKYNELVNLEPLRQLRTQRNQLLQQTDWRMTTDYPYSDQSAWASYRTALRDLPATASPALDENGQLTNVVWPTPPSDL